MGDAIARPFLNADIEQRFLDTRKCGEVFDQQDEFFVVRQQRLAHAQDDVLQGQAATALLEPEDMTDRPIHDRVQKPRDRFTPGGIGDRDLGKVIVADRKRRLREVETVGYQQVIAKKLGVGFATDAVFVAPFNRTADDPTKHRCGIMIVKDRVTKQLGQLLGVTDKRA